MRPITVLVLALALFGSATVLPAQREGGAAQPGRPGGAVPPGRQGGAAQPGRQGGQLPAGRAAQPTRDRPQSTGTAAIRGRVFAADNGTPLRRAEVQAMTGGNRPRGALTDSEGYFEFRDLPAGSWTLRASKSGFVAQQFGQRSPFAPAEPVVLTDGQQFIANFGLARGGVITGRVYDDFGDPVANARVAAMRVQSTPTGRRLVPSGTSVPTDDIGAYRVYGLAPGTYYVGVTMTAAAGNGTLTTSDGPITYGTVYFPGTVDITTAERITITAGQEQPGTNVAVRPVRAVSVSGVVIGSSGSPIQAIVNLQTQIFNDGPGAGGRNAGTAADGTFTLTNVSPGTYTIDVTGRVSSRDVPPEVASVPIVIGTEDLIGLTIATTRGAVVSGTIATDNGTHLESGSIRVTAPPMRSGRGVFTPRAQATASGTFDLEGLIGAHSLHFESLPIGWIVKSVTANGIDVTDVPMAFRGSEQVAVRVILTDRVAQLAGTIRSEKSTRGASILVFPDDETKWTAVSRYLRTARLTDTAQFTLRGLPPHQRYFAVALEYLETGEHLEPEFLRRVTPLATTVSLAEGEQKSVELPLIPRQ